MYYLVLQPDGALYRNLGAFEHHYTQGKKALSALARYKLRLRENEVIEVHPATGVVAERVAVDLIAQRNVSDIAWQNWSGANLPSRN